MLGLTDGRIVSGSMDCSLRVWDLFTSSCTHHLTGHTDLVKPLMELADGRVVSDGSFTEPASVGHDNLHLPVHMQLRAATELHGRGG